MSTCEWTSSAEKRKTRKRDAVTKPRGCFPSSGTAKISARCTILPGRADPLGPKIPRFLGIFGGSGLESETRKKCCFVHAPRQIRQAAGGCCVHCFVRSTGIGISRARSAQVRPRQKAFPPRARGSTAVRRPPTHPRAGDDAFRRRRRVFFFLFLPRGVRQQRTCLHLPRGARPAPPRPPSRRARGGSARASRRVLVVPASLTLFPAARRRALNHALVASKKQGVELALFRARDVFGTAKVARLRLRVRRGIFFPRTEASVTYRFFARGTPWRSL